MDVVNFMKRGFGILLPVFSLPFGEGIGDFGLGCEKWLEILHQYQIHYWEILPLNPTNKANCPYGSKASCAIDSIYISLDSLKNENLILSELPKETNYNKVDYLSVRKMKEKYLKEAFQRFSQEDQKEFLQFKMENPYLVAFSKFQVLEYYFPQLEWNQYPNKEDANLENYFLFLQFIAHKQWKKVLKKATQLDIKIIGDMPIYVDYHSVDVCTSPQDFQLDNNCLPLYCSGADPDCFNQEGQKWGHPLYNFENMKKNQYDYFQNKFQYYYQMFPIIRLDCFRTFDTYYKIPIHKSAKDGNFIDGPKSDLLDILFSRFSSTHFLVENLGSQLEGANLLKNKYQLMGMEIYQYGLPKEEKNCILYTGNHDNTTIVDWLNHCSNEKKDLVMKEITPFKEEDIPHKIIHYLASRKEDLVMIPVQDILGMGKEGILNTPGFIHPDNWTWRLTSFEEVQKNLPIIENIIIETKRT